MLHEKIAIISEKLYLLLITNNPSMRQMTSNSAKEALPEFRKQLQLLKFIDLALQSINPPNGSKEPLSFSLHHFHPTQSKGFFCRNCFINLKSLFIRVNLGHVLKT